MIHLKNLRLAKRLTLGFGAQTLLAIGLGAAALWGSASMQRAVQAVTQQGQESTAASRAMDDMHNMTQRLFRMALAKEPAEKQQLKAEVDALRVDYRNEMGLLKAADGTEEGRQSLARVEEAISSGKETNLRFVQLSLAGQDAEAAALLRSAGAEAGAKVRKSLDDYLAVRQKELAKTQAEAVRLGAEAEWVVAGSVAGSVALAIVFGVLITRSISGPIGMGVKLIEAMSQGDLTQEVPAGLRERTDETGELARALARLRASLGRSLLEVINGTGTLRVVSEALVATSERVTAEAKTTCDRSNAVAAAAEEASANTMSVAGSMDRAAANLASVATATEEMSATVGDIAANSAKARAVSEEAGAQAQAVAAVVNQLGQAAEAIGKVTETITGISAQTNLLALNATIEAARAGAAGKGFAVVANEIKALARQTAEATEDIKAKVAGVQSSTGSAIADIQKIAGVIRDVGGLVSSIAAAIEEQASVTKDVAGNVTQASAGVREANESVAQTAAVSKSIAQDVSGLSLQGVALRTTGAHVHYDAGVLLGVADQLKQLAGRFQLGTQKDFAPIKKGHLEWRNRLTDMFEGRQTLAPADVADHHQCPLGKWYDTEGTQDYEHLPSFGPLGARHQAFHLLVAEIVRLWNSGQEAPAREKFQELLPLTGQVFGVLDQLSMEAAQAGGDGNPAIAFAAGDAGPRTGRWGGVPAAEMVRPRALPGDGRGRARAGAELVAGR